MDLAGVTFGGAGLVHCLYALSARLPGVAITLCGPSGITRQVIVLTWLDQVAALCDSTREQCGSSQQFAGGSASFLVRTSVKSGKTGFGKDCLTSVFGGR
ncbi:hypothetical protein [Catellatospora sichuanensis]|uniref:hypothetical protein n=1 Tax=Catellatospora sichuanensis TaxID=1969805 RepID=UPI0011845356|nr:hypothetical protein [Catellatospora sichuanensis]